MAISYDILPEHMRAGARAYVESGRVPGGFLRAILENNFREAYSRADGQNRAALARWGDWLFNQCPMKAWGSETTVKDWIAKQGLRDRRRDLP